MIRATRTLVMLLFVLAGPAVAAPVRPAFPALSASVVDQAHLLPDNIRSQLAQKLTDYAQANGTQLVVVTVPTLNGYPIADYGYQLGRHWGIGQKNKNNGALLIVDRDEHKVRIEVGYGLEGTLTDARSSEIVRNVIVPRFRKGHYAQGIVAGAQAILQVLGGHPTAAAHAPPHHRAIPGLFLLFAAYLFLSALRARGAGAGGGGLLPGLLLGMGLGGGFGGGGGGDSGGGFSGGGGSFGGGGASGGW